MYPLLPPEIDIKKIKISDINYNDNKQFCNVTYHQNGTLYIQSPTFKFIEPIIIEQHVRNNHKALFLFLTPQDSNTYHFIELINKIENECVNTINNLHNRTLVANSIIKVFEEENKQIYMYIKITLLDQTKLEYNNNNITIEELNNLVRKVNLKVIFELNMLWISQTKIGVYLKPIKIKAIDIIEEPEILFRDEDSPIHNNLLYTEVDNIHNIINNNAMSLNESAFPKLNKSFEHIESIVNIQSKINIENDSSTSDKLDILQMNSSSSKDMIEPILNSNLDNSDSVDSSSSIKIEQISRKSKNKLRINKITKITENNYKT